VLLLFAASLFVSGTHPHYLAPVAPLLFLLVVNGLRQVDLWSWRGRALGRGLVVAVAALQILVFCVALALYAAEVPPAWATERARVRATLMATPGQHLVVVRYDPGHSPHEEWVYNEADIDTAKVVWARSMGEDQDRELTRYFAGRRLWSLYADRQPAELIEVTRESHGPGPAPGAAHD
jgi:hypothetical protein